ncbi:hypothetical protein [Chitinilyticum litopenaei]|uniref:hypothetical protein n=1 Tax=Chitinilyticum litopenaei TaxID=1121276 RepID=UPI000687A60D|nr:hypothetical protein [Chitinilyticum litopenaei]
MKFKWDASTLHIPLSILIFLSCLLLPAVYTSGDFDSVPALLYLISGWIGPFDGHFSWFANPLFLAALIYKNQIRKSCLLGLSALALALSFLLYKEMANGNSHSPITSYGWGYTLWVTSLAVFSAGQLLRILGSKDWLVIAASTSIGIALLTAYTGYYLTSENSIYIVNKERAKEFQRRCASSGEQIFKRTSDVSGIFYDPAWEREIITAPKNFTHTNSVGTLGDGSINSGLLLFYETRDEENPGKYLKYTLENRRGIPTEKLESEYEVKTVFYNTSDRLSIYGATVTIKDLRDNSILATSTHFVENKNGKFCGNSRGGFSTSRFIDEVLNLKRQYPSTYH